MSSENVLWAWVGFVLGVVGEVLIRPLHRLLDDAPLRARCGAAGRARWAELFTADTMADQTVALYRRLLSGAEAGLGEAGKVASHLPETTRTNR